VGDAQKLERILNEALGRNGVRASRTVVDMLMIMSEFKFKDGDEEKGKICLMADVRALMADFGEKQGKELLTMIFDEQFDEALARVQTIMAVRELAK